MSQFGNRNRASNNIKQGKGFVCPTCTSLVPAGNDVCYNCGDMPKFSAGSGYSKSSDTDNYMLTLFYFFLCSFISPVFYMFSNLTGNSDDNFLNFLIFLPNSIILITVVISIIRQRKNLGCLYGPLRLWVLVFSVLTAITNIEYLVYFLN